jgi:beta-glucosidase
MAATWDKDAVYLWA